MLSILAGAFIAFGAIFATTVSAGSLTTSAAGGSAAFATALPYGVVRLLTRRRVLARLILVVVAGAELFTSNNLIVLAWASGKVKTRAVLLNWTVAFAGNCASALSLLTAGLMFFTTQYTFGGGSVGLVALNTASAKTSIGVRSSSDTLGIMCNALVCLAVWMCYGARTQPSTGSLPLFPPITRLCRPAGFEHCIANVYFIPMGLFIKAGAPDSFWVSIGKTSG